jgi:hypothetical protein
MLGDTSRSELFGEVLELLESAAEEAGEEEAEGRIRKALIPFIHKEYVFAQMLEEK